jgi:hypothetical protein
MRLWTEDPLRCGFALLFVDLCYLPFPAAVFTNSRGVLASADESWANFRAVSSELSVQIPIGAPEGGSLTCPVFPVKQDLGTAQKVFPHNRLSVDIFKFRCNELTSAVLPLESSVCEGRMIVEQLLVDTRGFASV